MKQEFVSSIGLKSGEKNIKQQLSGAPWQNVDWFLHTWGFLPCETEVIEKLSQEALQRIVLLLLDYTWRKDSPIGDEVIGAVQKVLEEEKVSDYFIKPKDL